MARHRKDRPGRTARLAVPGGTGGVRDAIVEGGPRTGRHPSWRPGGPPGPPDAAAPAARLPAAPRGRRDWLCAGILLLAAVGLFWKGLADPVSIIHEDAADQFQPFYQHVAGELRAGRFPNWCPQASCGVPFHASLHGAVLYPLRWPLLWLSYPAGYVASLIFHHFLTGLFTYALLRAVLGCDPVPSLIGALSFQAGGFAMGHLTHWNYFQGLPWLVLAVLLVWMAIRRDRWSWALAASGPVGLLGLIGAVHLLQLLAAALTAWGLIESVSRAIRRLRHRWGGSWPAAARPVGMALAPLALGALIGAAQLWPAELQSRLSTRSQADWAFVTEMSAHPLRDALRLAAPFFYGNHRVGYWGEDNFHEHAFYAGIVPLVCAAMALGLWRREPWVRRLAIFAAVMACLSAGPHLPLFRLLYDWVPGFNRLRNPVRMLVWVQLALACLAAVGLQSAVSPAAPARSRARRLAAVIVSAAVLAVIAGAVVRLHALAIDSRSVVESVNRMDRLGEYDKALRLAEFDRMMDAVIKRSDGATWAAVLVGMASALAAGGVFASATLGRPAGGWALAALLAADLGLFSAGTFLYSDRSAAVTDRPGYVRFLQENLGVQRYLSQPRLDSAAADHRGMLFGLRNAATSDPGIFHTPRQRRFVEKLNDGSRRLIDLAGVKYLLSNAPSASPELREVYRGGGLRVIENPAAFPPAFLAQQVRVIADPDAVLAELADGNEDLRRVALVERALEPLPAGGGNASRDAAPSADPAGSVEEIRWRDNGYDMRVRSAGPAQLVLTETYHPQWRCSVGGRPADVERTDYLFMSVRVPAGEHQVRWWFEPVRFRQGLWVSGAGLAVWLASLILARRAERRGKAGG